MMDIEQLAINGELFDGRYKLLKTLSTDGGTADVWLAVDVNTIDNPELLGEARDDAYLEKSGMLVAIKIYRPKNALDIEGEQRFRDEYKIVHNCRHTNLLQPTNFSICGDTPYLELPYCQNGSSELLIGQQFTEKDIWKFVYDVSSGLSYLHACTPSIVHQDIKPANILIDDYRNYAITDFGISAQRGDVAWYYYDENNSGTMAYMAPERFRDGYTPIAESDIWAFGATLYEILTGSVPFQEGGGRNQMDNKTRIKPMGKHIPKRVQKLILSCLSLSPEDRPTANEILKISDKYLNSSKSKVVSVFALAILSIGILCFGLMKPSLEDSYEDALKLLNSDNPIEAKEGERRMEELSTQDYVPAMYELAKTYGWYKDSVSITRKKVLNIDYNANIGELSYGLPSSKYQQKARELYTRILECQDSTILPIKAETAYRIATYHANRNSGNVFKRDISLAKEYLLRAREYAIKSSQDSLLNVIERNLKNLEEAALKDSLKNK